MNHVHAGRCEECERDFYLIVSPNEDPRSLGNFVLYHLEERCEVLPSYQDLLDAA